MPFSRLSDFIFKNFKYVKMSVRIDMFDRQTQNICHLKAKLKLFLKKTITHNLIWETKASFDMLQHNNDNHYHHQ